MNRQRHLSVTQIVKARPDFLSADARGMYTACSSGADACQNHLRSLGSTRSVLAIVATCQLPTARAASLESRKPFESP